MPAARDLRGGEGETVDGGAVGQGGCGFLRESGIPVRGRRGYVELQLDGPDAAATLLSDVRATSDGVHAQRVAAAWSLDRGRCREDAQILVRWLDEGPCFVRAAVATALGLLGDHGTVEPLVRLLDEDDLDVRHAAAIALRRLGDPRGEIALFDVLEAMTRVEDPAARARAARTLRAMKSERALHLLDRLTRDTDPEVRADATESLRAAREDQRMRVTSSTRTLRRSWPNG